MRRQFLIASIIGALLPSTVFAMPTQQLVDLVIEKRVTGELLPGNRPVLNPKTLKVTQLEMASPYRYKPNYFQPAYMGRQGTMLKTYQIMPEHLDSVISVKDNSGQEIKRISVGRRAKRLLASPATNRMYVLCGGYFGSVWEIDTVQDTVVRKLPQFTPGMTDSPLWNPADIALFPSGHTLAVGSGKLQLVDTRTGYTTAMIELPENTQSIQALYPLSNTKLGIIAQGHKGQTQYFTYTLNQRRVVPVSYLGAPRVNLSKVSFRAPAPEAYRTAHHLSFVSSKNSDFIYVLDAQTMQQQAVIPVDFPVDQLLLTEDKKRLFAYHQRFGQVSVIELNPLQSKDYLSVIETIRDPRFKSESPMTLAQHHDQVYLWDGYSDIVASMHQDTLETKVNLPFRVRLRAPEEKVYLAQPSGKRFYLRDHVLFMEDIGAGSSSFPTKLSALGAHIQQIALSPDRKSLYALNTADGTLITLRTEDQKLLQRTKVGTNPTHMRMLKNGNIYVFSAHDGEIHAFDPVYYSVNPINVLDLGKEQPFVLTIFEQNPRQLIHIELPRYLKSVASLAG